MPNSTNRLQLQLPLGTDQVPELRQAITNHATALDAAVTLTSGPLSSLPAPSLAGRRYYATDKGIELWDTGTSWQPTGPALPIGAMAQWSINADPVDADGVTRWMVADGRQNLLKTNFPALNNLFAAAGYPFGQGGNYLWLPDYRGRVVVGSDVGVGTGAAGRVTSNNTVGTGAGVQTYGLLAAESGTNGKGATGGESGHQHYINRNAWSVPMAVSGFIYAAGGANITAGAYPYFYPNSALANDTQTSGAFGTPHVHGLVARDADNAHNNMQPYLVAHHIIRVL